MNKPQVGIASVSVNIRLLKPNNSFYSIRYRLTFFQSYRWYEGNPCNMHLLQLAAKVKEGVKAAGLIGYRFNTVGVSDGISMGTKGMRYSLQSRDLIADSIETVSKMHSMEIETDQNVINPPKNLILCVFVLKKQVMGAQWYDANIAIPGCDKNMPGCVMAMARHNHPSIMIYGGTIRAGRSKCDDVLDVISAFQAYGSYVAGKITEEQRCDIVKNACPGPGACGGMYTANTSNYNLLRSFFSPGNNLNLRNRYFILQ
jgi:dihydroxy-acid dehydratase